MFILCFFFLNGILVFTSVCGNRALSGRATGGETIHRSLGSGAQTSCKSPNLLKFLCVGAMSHRFVQIPYRNISGEAVLQSPISARNFAANDTTSWSLNSFGFRFPSKKCTVKSFKNSSCVPTAIISASGCISCVKSTRPSAAFAIAASTWTDLPTPHLNIHLKKSRAIPMWLPSFSIFFHTSFTQYDCLFMPVLRIHSLSTTWSEATTAYSGNSSCCRRAVPCRNGTFRERWLPAPSALAATSSSDRGRTPRYWPCSLSCSKRKGYLSKEFQACCGHSRTRWSRKRGCST